MGLAEGEGPVALDLGDENAIGLLHTPASNQLGQGEGAVDHDVDLLTDRRV